MGGETEGGQTEGGQPEGGLADAESRSESPLSPITGCPLDPDLDELFAKEGLERFLRPFGWPTRNC